MRAEKVVPNLVRQRAAENDAEAPFIHRNQLVTSSTPHARTGFARFESKSVPQDGHSVAAPTRRPGSDRALAAVSRFGTTSTRMRLDATGRTTVGGSQSITTPCCPQIVGASFIIETRAAFDSAAVVVSNTSTGRVTSPAPPPPAPRGRPPEWQGTRRSRRPRHANLLTQI